MPTGSPATSTAERFAGSPSSSRRTLRHVRFSSRGGYYMQLAATFGWTSLPWLFTLRQPTLVMAGADDPLVPTINARIMQWLIPDARLAILDCGHLFLITLPDGVGAHRGCLSRRNPTNAARQPGDAHPIPPGDSMNPLDIARTRSAHDAPLSIGSILDRGLAVAPTQEIVYGDRLRYTYATLGERVRRLASALDALGVKPGSTVAIMDWDSHRYLECFFAVPMMGAVLHTVNVRISAEQVLYTINHAADDVILVNAEFLPLLEAIHAKIRPGVKLVLINDGEATPQGDVPFAAEYEAMLARRRAVVPISGARREHPRDDVLHDRDDRAAQGRLLQPSPAGAAYAGHDRPRSRTRRTRRSLRATSTCRSRRCSTSTPGGFPTSRRCWA